MKENRTKKSPTNTTADADNCHEVVKSSGTNQRRSTGICDMHRLSSRKVSVACQTDNSSHTLDTAACSKHTTSKSADPAKSEGTLKLMIKNFHNMNDTVRGPGVMINHVPWKIMVMPRQHVMQKKGTQKCLGFFLQCCPESYSDSWTCQASAELRLISQKTGVQNFTRKTTHNYSAKENDWGYSCFMTWADILDEAQGFIKDDKVILEVHVKAELPKNVLTFDGFAKKIQDYMRLAEMQSSRGLIDKAIEVNQSALKFCKEKDDGCKVMLEEQNQKLIDLKVQQRIDHIEKGKTNGVFEENIDDAGNLQALKQALTGTTITKTSTASKDGGSSTGGGKKRKKGGHNGTVEEEKPVQKSTPPPVEEEASTSGDEGDVDDDLEPCDGCLQEQIEAMEINKENVQMCDGECQTDVPAVKKALLEPSSFDDDHLMDENLLLAAAAANGGSATAGQLLSELELIQQATNMTTDRTCLSDDDDTALITSHLSTLRRRISEGTIDAAMIEAMNVNSLRDSVKEQHLIDLITSESRTSLDSIRDTLERLVQLTQDGETHPQLDLDLETLRSVKRRGRGLLPMSGGPNNTSALGRMDIVEIPGTPPDTDVVDLGTGDGAPIVVPKRSGSVSPTTMSARLSHHDALADLPFTFNDRDELLVAKAKIIVDAAAEQVVQKYSEMTVQSDAARLAENMKKVQERMKEIERQTATCRKELADECERHHRDEQKLQKEVKQAKHEATKEKANSERLTGQLRDKKAELKKLEKRVKQQESVSDELVDLKTRNEQSEKETEVAKKELRDASKKTQREQQKLIDQKKQLQQELTASGSECERITQQFDEKAAHLRKAEHRHDQERKSHNSQQRDLLDRARKAERQSTALRTLNNAAEESVQAAKHWEAEAKRYLAAGIKEDVTVLQSTAGEWRSVREKVADTVTQMKKDYSQQIEQIRSGKHTLSSLQPLDMPKPPAQPKPPHLSVLLEREGAPGTTTVGAQEATSASTTSSASKVSSMAPIGSARPPCTPNAQGGVPPVTSSTPTPTTTPHQQQQRQTSPSEVAAPQQQQQSSRPSSVPHTPVPMSTIHLPSSNAATTTSATTVPMPQHSYSAGGYSGQQGRQTSQFGGANAINYTPPPFPGDAPPPQQQQQAAQQQQSGGVMNGFNPWSDHFSIGDTLMRTSAMTNGTSATTASSNANAPPSNGGGGGWDQWGGQWQQQQQWSGGFGGEKGVASAGNSPTPDKEAALRFAELMKTVGGALPGVDSDQIYNMLQHYRSQTGNMHGVQAHDVINYVRGMMQHENKSGGQQWPSLQNSASQPPLMNMDKFSRPPPNMSQGNGPQRGW